MLVKTTLKPNYGYNIKEIGQCDVQGWINLKMNYQLYLVLLDYVFNYKTVLTCPHEIDP